jgi:hypothetical protein
MSGALHGKVGGAFTSSATQHGGNEKPAYHDESGDLVADQHAIMDRDLVA